MICSDSKNMRRHPSMSVHCPELYSRRYVYIARCGDLYKIGSSGHPKGRIYGLNSTYKQRHELIISIAISGGTSPFPYENALHRWYADVRVYGEYFRLTDDDLSDLETLAVESMDWPLGTTEAWLDRCRKLADISNRRLQAHSKRKEREAA